MANLISGTRALMKRYDIRPVKSLGQNFLVDTNIVNNISALPELGPDDTVCEIGSGFGSLTAELSARAGRVIAIEKDSRMIPALMEALTASGAIDNVEVVCADFLDYDLGLLPAGCKLVGNLPYRVTTPILMKAVDSPDIPPVMVFMMQREVAERICASPGGKDYGAVSVAIQYRYKAEYAMDVSREVFMPRPNVDSAVVVLKSAPERCGTPKDEALFFAVIKAGFGQRRKMLRNALSSLAPNAGALEAAFTRAGVKGTARAETLSVDDFIALSDALAEVRSAGRIVGQAI
ncbi:MAG: 16S rRNA (adenine(1518)-N(6)/adenine(1519)-N(6))-dimethyltransferase RsmA [Clostridiales Family XIII bacterium]|nr:16S rRNA (adenine(1518)-N(6)/adenine(1519)-N(6))-dimethyltransferase RsmA [Clostridiales Family XIII bacterium]